MARSAGPLPVCRRRRWAKPAGCFPERSAASNSFLRQLEEDAWARRLAPELQAAQAEIERRGRAGPVAHRGRQRRLARSPAAPRPRRRRQQIGLPPAKRPRRTGQRPTRLARAPRRRVRSHPRRVRHAFANDALACRRDSVRPPVCATRSAYPYHPPTAPSLTSYLRASAAPLAPMRSPPHILPAV